MLSVLQLQPEPSWQYTESCNLFNNLRRIKPPIEYKDAYLKWQKELNILEERYEKAFDKYLDEKKELDKVSRLY